MPGALGAMIEPKPEDVGRRVIYRNGFDPPEEGTITSFNGHSVFVRYGAKIRPQATSRGDLVWASDAIAVPEPLRVLRGRAAQPDTTTLSLSREGARQILDYIDALEEALRQKGKRA